MINGPVVCSRGTECPHHTSGFIITIVIGTRKVRVRGELTFIKNDLAGLRPLHRPGVGIRGRLDIRVSRSIDADRWRGWVIKNIHHYHTGSHGPRHWAAAGPLGRAEPSSHTRSHFYVSAAPLAVASPSHCACTICLWQRLILSAHHRDAISISQPA